MFRNRERVCGRLLCGSIPDNIIDCCQNIAICYIRVRYCIEKMEDRAVIGVDDACLCCDISGLDQCGDANFRVVVWWWRHRAADIRPRGERGFFETAQAVVRRSFCFLILPADLTACETTRWRPVLPSPAVLTDCRRPRP